MKKVSFTKAGLESYLLTSPKLGEEICAIEDKRWRAWSRKKGVVLGFEIHVDGKRLRQTVGVYGDISITTFKEQVSRIFAEKQLNGIATTAQTLTQYFHDAYLKYSKASHKNLKATLCNWGRLSSGLKNRKMGSIKREHIQLELTRLSESGLSNASVNRTRSFLSSVFRLTVADGLISSSPVTHVKSRHEQIQPAFALSAEAYKRYVELAFKADNQIHGYTLVLAALSGARISEIRSIKVADVAEDLRSFTLRDTKNLDSRVVHIGPEAAKAIEKAVGMSTNQYLFSSAQSETGFIGYPRDTHDKLVDQMIDEGVVNSRFLVKDLRSTCGTMLFQQTENLEAVRRQLGHRSVNITAKYYLQPTDKYCQKLMEDLEDDLNVA